MNISINRFSRWLNQHPKLSQWLWFVIFWFGGLLMALALAYPIKLLVRSMS